MLKHTKIHVSLIVAWPEPELLGSRSPNHFGLMEPRHIGYRQKALVIMRTILTLYWGQNVGISEKERKLSTLYLELLIILDFWLF